MFSTASHGCATKPYIGMFNCPPHGRAPKAYTGMFNCPHTGALRSLGRRLPAGLPSGSSTPPPPSPHVRAPPPGQVRACGPATGDAGHFGLGRTGEAADVEGLDVLQPAAAAAPGATRVPSSASVR